MTTLPCEEGPQQKAARRSVTQQRRLLVGTSAGSDSPRFRVSNENKEAGLSESYLELNKKARIGKCQTFWEAGIFKGHDEQIARNASRVNRPAIRSRSVDSKATDEGEGGMKPDQRCVEERWSQGGMVEPSDDLSSAATGHTTDPEVGSLEEAFGSIYHLEKPVESATRRSYLRRIPTTADGSDLDANPASIRGERRASILEYIGVEVEEDDDEFDEEDHLASRWASLEDSQETVTIQQLQPATQAFGRSQLARRDSATMVNLSLADEMAWIRSKTPTVQQLRDISHSPHGPNSWIYVTATLGLLRAPSPPISPQYTYFEPDISQVPSGIMARQNQLKDELIASMEVDIQLSPLVSH